MGDQSKIEVIQQAYACFGKGDIPGILELLHEQVSWIDPGYPDLPYAGRRSGKEEVVNFFQQLDSYVQFTTFEARNFLSDGDYVVQGYFEGLGRQSGKAFASDWAMIWTVDQGLISSYQAYADTVQAAKALK